jgi:cell pole-organizing protein PopZ
MSQKAAKAQEPSMEEILASIRRIISDENGSEPASKPVPERPAPPPLVSAAKPAAPAVSAPAAPPPPQEPDVLELTDMVETKSEPVFKPVESPDVEFRDQARKRQELRQEPEPLAPAALPARAAYPMRLDEQLLSQRASEAVSAAFGTLANTMFEGSRTIEDVVREMLKPMLQTWLEDNLPSLVERLVRAEIERVSRGGRQ